MARNLYGATSADFTLTSGGRVVPGAVLTIWSARTGGTQITDLLDRDSATTTTVASGGDGSVVYYGPDNDKSVHWADSGQGSRIAIRPVDITGEAGPGSGILTDKGDLLARSASADTRQAAGSDGQVLVADSTASNGLTWVRAADLLTSARLPMPIRPDTDVYISTITWPQIAAHRFGPAHYGENTMASARMALAAGIKVLECDFRRTSDGGLVLMHDATIDRTTNGSGTVTAMTGAQIAAVRVDDFSNPGWTDYAFQRVPTLQEVALQVRGKAVVVAEDKGGLTGTALTAAAAELRSLGLTDTVIIQCVSQSVCEGWVAEGFTAMLVSSTDLADPAAVRGAGIEWVGYSWLGTAADATRIAAAKSAGLKVATWTHFSVGGHDDALAAGSDMPMSNYPAYGIGGNYVDFTQVPPAPPAGVAPDTVDWVIDSGLLRCTGSSASEMYADMPGLGPTAGTSVTFDVVFRHVGSSISDATRWGSLFLASHEGGYKSSATGYHIIARLNGTLNIYTWNGTAAASIATKTGASLSGDADHTLTVTVTPTTITASTNGNVVTVTNNTYRPAGGWWPSWARSTLPEIGVRSVSWRV